jgi:hypothetical protein
MQPSERLVHIARSWARPAPHQEHDFLFSIRGKHAKTPHNPVPFAENEFLADALARRKSQVVGHYRPDLVRSAEHFQNLDFRLSIWSHIDHTTNIDILGDVYDLPKQVLKRAVWTGSSGSADEATENREPETPDR